MQTKTGCEVGDAKLMKEKRRIYLWHKRNKDALKCGYFLSCVAVAVVFVNK